MNATQEKANSSEVLRDVLERNNHDPSALIAILQDLQRTLMYLPREVLIELSELLEIPLSRVFSVASFYKAFKMTPPGKHIIKVCLGTACHIKGGPDLIRTFEGHLGVKQDEVTGDGLFSYEPVMCLGCCGLAPVVMIDETFYGKVSSKQIPKMLAKYKTKEED